MAKDRVNQDRLGLGSRKLVVITVTTTPTLLSALVATAGKAYPGSHRHIIFTNNGSNIVYLPATASYPSPVTDSPSIAVTGGTRAYEASKTFYDAPAATDDAEEGILFATSAGTSKVTVEFHM